MIHWAGRLLWAALIISALAIAVRAIAGPYRFGVSVNSPMNAEAVFALSGIGLLASPGGGARRGRFGSAAPHTFVAFATLLGAGFLAYAWTFHFPFLADDYDHIPHAMHATVANLLAQFTQPAADRFFRPLGFIAYAVEARVADYGRVPWHALSLAIHVGVSFLVYVLARRRFKAWVALAAALLFLLHGSRPEAVTWIAAQFDLWAALFFLLALLAFERGWRVVSLAPLLLALLSKESAYVYPLILLWMLWVDRVPVGRWARLAGPSFLLTAAVFGYRWWLLGGIGGYRNIGTDRAYILTFDFFRTGKALTARLAAALEFPINWTHPLEWWLVAALIGALAGGAALCFGKADRRKLWFAVGFLLLAALPVHEFLLIDSNLEKSRVLYLPSVGFALIFAAVLEAARVRVAVVGVCAILAFQAAALEHNLIIWGGVARLAESTCAGVARIPGPVALSDISNTVDGVYFLHTGLRGCVERAGKAGAEVYLVTEPRAIPAASSLEWDDRARRFVGR